MTQTTPKSSSERITQIARSTLRVAGQQQILLGYYILKIGGNEVAYIFTSPINAVVGGTVTQIGQTEHWALTSNWQTELDQGEDDTITIDWVHDSGTITSFAAFKTAMQNKSINDYVECRCLTFRF